MNPNDVTAVVLTRNEALNLPRALDSLPAGTRVLVVDSESTDETASIARARGAEVIVRPFAGFVKTREFALAQVRTPYVLMLDADEQLDGALREALLSASDAVDGYEVERTTFYCGRALRMWSGELLLRLFRAGRARLQAVPAAGGSAELHERWVCEGSVQRLPGTLLHYSYPTHAAYREKFERYTGIEAAGTAPSRKAALKQFALVPLRFGWYALGRRAVLDGAAGLRVAWFSALYPAVVQWKARR